MSLAFFKRKGVVSLRVSQRTCMELSGVETLPVRLAKDRADLTEVPSVSFLAQDGMGCHKPFSVKTCIFIYTHHRIIAGILMVRIGILDLASAR